MSLGRISPAELSQFTRPASHNGLIDLAERLGFRS
jgi:hypothetical protein